MITPTNTTEATLLELLQEQIAQNKQLREQLGQLQHQLATLQAMVFGQKSEKRRSNALELPKATNDKLEAHPVENSKDNKTPENNRNGRRQLPLNLERQKIRYDIPEDKRHCPHCQYGLHCIGKEVTEQLDYIPAKLIAIEHIRYKYSCRGCKQYLVTAAMPEQPIDKGLAGPGLLAEILIDKYQDALPLYRQQLRFARLGYELPRSTLCDWVMQCADRLKPIVDAMTTACLMPARKIHTDDTPFPILASGKTHTGRLWVYVGKADNAPPCTIYRYSKTRAQQVPMQFLKDYQGYLQADAYPGYDKLYQDGKIIEVACFAHARRKFADIVKNLKEPCLANQALDFIGLLYDIERRAKAMTIIQRYHFRKRRAKPILKIFYRWLSLQKLTAPPKSPLGQAVKYALNHWRALNHYLSDGILDIDNNRAERAIKPFVIGRKNFLFAGSHFGAEQAAVIYSLIESCKMMNINTFDYFKDVLTRLPATLNKNISDLFPCFWKPFRT
jgi:transposase